MIPIYFSVLYTTTDSSTRSFIGRLYSKDSPLIISCKFQRVDRIVWRISLHTSGLTSGHWTYNFYIRQTSWTFSLYIRLGRIKFVFSISRLIVGRLCSYDSPFMLLLANSDKSNDLRHAYPITTARGTCGHQSPSENNSNVEQLYHYRGISAPSTWNK